MKKELIVVILLALPSLVNAQDVGNGLGGRDFIEVRGSAVAIIEPNQISVSVILSENETKGKVLLTQLDQSFASALQESGIDVAKSVVLSGQSSAADKKKGAFLFKSYSVTLTCADQVDRFFGALKDNQINSASITRAFNSNQMAILDSLKVEAVKNAKQLATQLSAGLGQKVGPAFQVIDNNYYQPIDNGYFRPNYMMAKSVSNADSDAGAGLGAGVEGAGYKKNTFSQSVTVRFHLNWK